MEKPCFQTIAECFFEMLRVITSSLSSACNYFPCKDQMRASPVNKALHSTTYGQLIRL